MVKGRAPEKGAATEARPRRGYAGVAVCERGRRHAELAYCVFLVRRLEPVESLVQPAELGEDLVLRVGRLAVLVLGVLVDEVARDAAVARPRKPMPTIIRNAATRRPPAEVGKVSP